MDPRLTRLRVELYSAAQMLKGEDAEEFWKLIDEVHDLKTALRPKDATYELVVEKGATGIRRLVCGLTSYHPQDVERRYCGNCHRFHDIRKGGTDD